MGLIYRAKHLSSFRKKRYTYGDKEVSAVRRTEKKLSLEKGS